MYLKYGSYSHESGECEVSISKNVIRGADNKALYVTHRWDVRGRLQATDSAALTSAVWALEAAYARDGYDMTLYYDGGATWLHNMVSAVSLGGTRVVQPPMYPEGKGAEGGTYRNYTLAVECDFLTDQNNTLLEFQETVSYYGGGPLIVFKNALYGPPQKQMAVQQTPYEAEQTGRLLALRGYLPPRAAYWPSALEINPRITYASPKRSGGRGGFNFTQYETTWSYKYKASTPFGSAPTAAIL